MARAPKLNAAWFTHSAGLRHDRRVLAIRNATGAAGYGILHFLLETLTEADYTTVPVDAFELELLAGDFGVDSAAVSQVLEAGKRVGWFVVDERQMLTCPELNNWLALHFKKREVAREQYQAAVQTVQNDSVTEIVRNRQTGTEIDRLEQTVTGITHSTEHNSTGYNNTEVLCETDVSHMPELASKKSPKKKKAGSDPVFEDFWGRYDKKVNRKRTEVRWGTLSAAQQQQALARVDAYVKATPDPKFRKDPSGWLYDERFADESLPPTGMPAIRHQAPQPPRARYALT